jgi:ubiquinone/menaquinone biosynthesis C-methylase UbiE
MPTASPVSALFTSRADSYGRFIELVRYPQGLRRYFLASPLLRTGQRVLDAGCGTGAVTLALREALGRRGLAPAVMHGFDLTPAMLARFRERLHAQRIEGVESAQADILCLERLPDAWSSYDLIVSASMLEYLPPGKVAAALGGLRARLAPGGRLILFITRRNWLMRPLIGRWWHGNLYTRPELGVLLREAGFREFAFGSFPLAARHLSFWGHVVEASA